MAILPHSKTTSDKIFSHYKESSDDHRRPHLGASIIGKKCSRELWYTFHWAITPDIPGRIYRLFETGKIEENRIIQNLRDIGIDIQAEKNGEQISFSLFGGHFSGSLDGIASGFTEAPKSKHVLEVKTANGKHFKNLKKHGIKISKPDHYAQCCMYMYALNIDKTYYICVNKNTDEIYQERFPKDPKYAKKLIEKAEKIIFTDGLIPEKSESYECNWCNYKEICAGNTPADVNCRTCAHSTAEASGIWSCKRKRKINLINQKSACENHVFSPRFVPLHPINADPGAGWIEYEGNIINGPGFIASNALWEALNV